MLVLTRRKEEIIRLNDDIIIKVVHIGGDKVRIGIDAPTSVVIHREEIYERILKERAAK